MTTLEKPSLDVRGKRVRLSWTDGPTRGTTQEHVFHRDGTVEWHSVENGKTKDSPGTKLKPAAEAERPRYAMLPIAEDAILLSYLSKSGYTLTVALRFDDEKVVGIASNDKTWFPVHGTFEIFD